MNNQQSDARQHKQRRCSGKATRAIRIVAVSGAIRWRVTVTICNGVLTRNQIGTSKRIVDMMVGKDALKRERADKKPGDHEPVPMVSKQIVSWQPHLHRQINAHSHLRGNRISR